MVRRVTNSAKLSGRASARPAAPKLKKTAFGVGSSSSNPHRKLDDAKVNGGSARTSSKIRILNMYKGGKAIRNKKGQIVGGEYMMKTRAGGKEIDATTGRVAPDRRWFGNTRTVSATELDKFREEMRVKAADPYSVILRRKKLPMGLLVEANKSVLDGGRSQLLEVESFEDTFNGKRTRKRPKLETTTLDGLVVAAEKKSGKYGDGAGDRDLAEATVDANDSFRAGRKHDMFMKGQSKRIWSELYKVIDCSDVVLQVLDARNIPGTRCRHLEVYLKKHAAHKHLVLIVNKCDLVPTWVTKQWVTRLSQTVPTLAFHASMGSPFGKGALITLLRQYAKLHADKKAISVGIVGYPNVGKSSIINTLRAKKVCKTAPVPGETKIWQYVSLMKRISLVDCPGIVYDTGDNETETVLKGVVRAERLPDPDSFIPAILERSKPEHISRTYGIPTGWKDAEDFMTQIARRNGRLLPGGEPDFHAVAVNVINDWQRGKLPFFVPPPAAGDVLFGEGKNGLGETSLGAADMLNESMPAISAASSSEAAGEDASDAFIAAMQEASKESINGKGDQGSSSDKDNDDKDNDDEDDENNEKDNDDNALESDEIEEEAPQERGTFGPSEMPEGFNASVTNPDEANEDSDVDEETLQQSKPTKAAGVLDGVESAGSDAEEAADHPEPTPRNVTKQSIRVRAVSKRVKRKRMKIEAAGVDWDDL